jgi:hypothetical protein
MRINALMRCSYYPVALSVLFGSCTARNLVEKSGPWESIQYREYLIENNTWNIQAIKGKWSETIFCDTLQGVMGWKWDFSDEKDQQSRNVVKSFPEIIYGKKPYKSYQSTTPLLPVKMSAAHSRIKYDYSANARGIYNTSTDISFSDSIVPIESNIRAKMMIWFDHQNFPFFETEKLEQDSIGGLHYKVFADTAHVGPEGKWVFIALLPDHFPSKGELDLKAYFDYFICKGILKPGWYLSSIEIGSEIASGKGTVTFKKFEVIGE